MVRGITGCELGRTNRMKIEQLEKGQEQIMIGIKDIQAKNTEMFNHFTERYEEMFEKAMKNMPQWLAWTIAAGCSLIVSLVTFIVTH